MLEKYLLLVTLAITIWFWYTSFLAGKSQLEIMHSSIPDEIKMKSLWTVKWYIRIQYILAIINVIVVALVVSQGGTS